MDLLTNAIPLSYTIAASAVVLTGAALFLLKRRKSEPQLIVKNPVKDLVYLFQFSPVNGVNPSPYCLKLESFLRVNRIPYKVIKDRLLSAPRGKLPFIQFNDQIIPDSETIINFLSKKFEIDIDSNLTNEQRAQSISVTRIVEAHLNFLLIYYRWVEEKGWQVWSKLAFKGFLKKFLISKLARSRVNKIVYAQGISRYTEEELLKSASEDFDALSTILGDKEFIVSSKFTVADASTYGCLHNILSLHDGCPLKELLLKYDNLIKYINRVHELVTNSSE